jgi:tetraacyldisaccharide 4'-kinase
MGTFFYLRGLNRDQQRARSRARGLPAFVISVGNVVVGGTGKTPLTLWLADTIHRRGYSVAILSRGYGRKGSDVAKVPDSGETLPLTRLYGDEPVLMARKIHGVSVWVGRERYRAGLAAWQSLRPQVLILDDGFQHLALERDLDLVLLDAGHPFGNGEILPLGPLREPVSNLARADAFILTRAQDPEQTAKTRRLLEKRFPGKPVLACSHRLTEPTAGLGETPVPYERLSNASVAAFAGIARPEAFFEALRRKGVYPVREWAFQDHHGYSREELREILETVRQKNIHSLITTEKDTVRLPSWFQSFTLAAGLELDFGADLSSFRRILDDRLMLREDAPCFRSMEPCTRGAGPF